MRRPRFHSYWNGFPTAGFDINIEIMGITIFEIIWIHGLSIIILNFEITF